MIDDLHAKLRTLAEMPIQQATLTLSRDECRDLADALDDLESLRWERDNRPGVVEPWKPSDGHWLVTNDGTAMSCVGEIADLDIARVRVALEQCAHEAGMAIVKLGSYRSAMAASTAVLDVVARHYAEGRPADAT